MPEKWKKVLKSCHARLRCDHYPNARYLKISKSDYELIVRVGNKNSVQFDFFNNDREEEYTIYIPSEDGPEVLKAFEAFFYDEGFRLEQRKAS